MRGSLFFLKALLTGAVLVICFSPLSTGQENSSGSQSGRTVLIVYHSGQPPWSSSPSLEKIKVDDLTHATTKYANVKVVAIKIRDRLNALGYRVDLLKATDVKGPHEFLDYDGIIFGTPTWFSNIAYPLKKVFDEHLIRIYEHRKGRLNDKALSGFTTVMERGESGPNCLKCLTWGIEHLSTNTIEGVVINTGDDSATLNAAVKNFCERFSEALK